MFSMLLVGAVASLVSPIPYCTVCDAPGPTFKVLAMTFVYPGRYTSIRSVDFRNLALPLLDLKGNHVGRVSLKQGQFKSNSPDDHFEEHLDSVHYLPTASGTEFALGLYAWSDVGVSSSQGSEAVVFRLTQGRLSCIQTVRWDTYFHAGGRTELFDQKRNVLLIRSAHYLPGDAHCCVSAMDVVTFRWTGSKLGESSLRTELSNYGRSTGKALKAP